MTTIISKIKDNHRELKVIHEDSCKHFWNALDISLDISDHIIQSCLESEKDFSSSILEAEAIKREIRIYFRKLELLKQKTAETSQMLDQIDDSSTTDEVESAVDRILAWIKIHREAIQEIRTIAEHWTEKEQELLTKITNG